LISVDEWGKGDDPIELTGGEKGPGPALRDRRGDQNEKNRVTARSRDQTKGGNHFKNQMTSRCCVLEGKRGERKGQKRLPWEWGGEEGGAASGNKKSELSQRLDGSGWRGMF